MKPPTSLLKSLTPLARLLGVAGLAIGLTATSARADDDFQTWQTVSLKWLDTKYMNPIAFSPRGRAGKLGPTTLIA